MVKRVENLESALQGSLQHTAEQEEALIRWQELAEVTEKKANALESELESMKFQFKESTQVVEMLRTQREKLEKEWERANAELMDVVRKRGKLQVDLEQKSSRLDELEEESVKLRESLQILQHRFDTQPPEYESALAKLETAEATNADLKEKLLKAEHESADHYEHWLWTKASLDTTCSELDALRLVAGQYDEMIAQLQGKLAESESQAEKWKNSVGRMTDLLYEAERKVKEMEEKVVQVRQQAQDDEKKEEMRKQVREQQLQIDQRIIARRWSSHSASLYADRTSFSSTC
jgi:chromosome segregation ATPase